ncbi:TonB-dependent receptor domain-containing protein [Sphingobacterium daejeonense]|uniref:TonB-dependent receptor domain-containing protein n=1 Tax=Sphingobacterium daejeonense TaxID=371142 RepID=UPI0010FD274B|nr:TonB-dependent receptor [Sphingobacterium daejeonense]
MESLCQQRNKPKNPTFTDLYLNQRPGNIGNPDLKSENAWQNEISTSFQKNSLTLKGGYFYRDIDNFIDWVRASTDEPFQAPKFREQ